MKKSPLQFGIIVLSALVTVSAGLISFRTIKDLGEVSVLNALSSDEESDLPLSYETRIKKGDQFFKEGYYEDAATQYSLALQVQEHAEAHSKLGEAQVKLLNFEAAVTAFDRAFELKPSNSNLNSYAHALIYSQNFKLAKQVLSRGDDNDQETLYLRALIHLLEGDLPNARNEMSQALEVSGPVLPAFIQGFLSAYSEFEAQQGGQDLYLKALLVKASVDAEEHSVAEHLALQILNEKSDYRDVWVLLGYAQLQLEQYQEAEDAFKEAKSLDGIKPETHYFLGITHFKQEKFEDALKSFELALLYNFAPETEIYQKLADTYSVLGRHEEAVEAYEFLLNRNPASVDLFVLPFEISLNILHDLDRSLTLAQGAVTEFPEEAVSHQLLAEVYFARGETEQAAASIETALDIDPRLALAHYTAAAIQLARGDQNAAKEEFKKTYELSEPGSELNIKAAQDYNALILKDETQP